MLFTLTWSLLLALPILGSQNESPQAASSLGSRLRSELHGKLAGMPEQETALKVSMGDFGYGPHRIPTPFARVLEEELARVLGEEKRVEVYARRDLHQVASELEKSFYPEVWTVNAEVGDWIQTEAILTGSYAIEEQQLVLRLKLLDVRTTREWFHIQWTGPLSEQQRRQVAPPGLPAIEKAMADITPVGEPDFETTLWVDRGERAQYGLGETMTVHLKSERECYVKLYYLQADGKIKRLYPNRFSTQTKLTPGETVTLPESDNYSFRFTEPIGVEILFAEMSTTPFSRMEPDFETLGTTEDLSKVRTRGIEVVAGKASELKRSWARALISVATK